MLETVIAKAGSRVLSDMLPRIASTDDRMLIALDEDERRQLFRLLTLATS